MKKSLLVEACSLALAACSAAAAEDLSALVDKIANAYGGRAALENFTALRETGRILFTAGTTKSGSAGPMTFETRYDDFQTVEGRLFAFKETNFAGGMKTAEIVLTKVELLNAPPADAFKP